MVRVRAGGEDGEVSAVQDGEVPQQDVVGVLQRDGLVAHARIFRVWLLARAAAEAFAPDEPGTADAEVRDTFADDEAVVPVRVSVVLELVPFVRLGHVVLAGSAGLSGHDLRTLVEMEKYFALQVNGEAGIRPGREENRSTARRGRSLDCTVHRRCVDRVSIARCAKIAHAEESAARWR
jgi:hypothetical protein